MVRLRNTVVSIKGSDFLINGRLTYEGRVHNGLRVEGLLFNSRMVQAVFDDLNPKTRLLWDYPDGPWDPQRNSQEFVAATPEWRKHGLLGFTINLQRLRAAGAQPSPHESSRRRGLPCLARIAQIERHRLSDLIRRAARRSGMADRAWSIQPSTPLGGTVPRQGRLGAQSRVQDHRAGRTAVSETRYQRVAREQRERQAAREAALKAARKPRKAATRYSREGVAGLPRATQQRPSQGPEVRMTRRWRRQS